MTRPIPGGFLVAIEGIDGSGKTTQAKMLGNLCAEKGLDYSVSKEPTRGKYGSILRESALTGRLTVEEELDLFLRDRRDHVENLIKPALARGEVVILDRYYYSTAAYQGSRGADPNIILRQNEEFAPPPDLLVMLDVPPHVGLQRIRQRGDSPNAFETEESLEHARQIFNSVKPSSLFWMDARTGPDILHFHISKAFFINAMNKISASDLSPAGVNRARELFGEETISLQG